MSTPPNRPTAASTQARALSAPDRSTGARAPIWPPASVTSLTVSALAFSSRSQPNTAAPCAANSSAAARPMPRAVPLISATLPSNLPIRRYSLPVRQHATVLRDINNARCRARNNKPLWQLSVNARSGVLAFTEPWPAARRPG